MKRKLLQPYQTIWSLGRIHWLQRYNPTLLISLHQKNKLKSHALKFTDIATKGLTSLMMYTPDREAWEKIMSLVFPNREKKVRSPKITDQQMQEIYNSLELTPKIINYLTEDYNKIFRLRGVEKEAVAIKLRPRNLVNRHLPAMRYFTKDQLEQEISTNPSPSDEELERMKGFSEPDEKKLIEERLFMRRELRRISGLPLTREQIESMKQLWTSGKKALTDQTSRPENKKDDQALPERSLDVNLVDLKDWPLNYTFKSTPEKTAEMKKKLTQLVKLISKTTGKTPKEVLKGMKEWLDRRDLARKN